MKQAKFASNCAEAYCYPSMKINALELLLNELKCT